MLAEYKQKTNVGIGGGLLMQIGGNVLMGSGTGLASVMGLLLMLGGWGVFIWGTISYAKGKGHHGAWGLLGIASLLGLICLMLLPDRHK